MALGVSRLDQVVDASGPYEKAKVERDGTLVTDLHDGAVHIKGKNANDDGESGVDLKNGQVKINGRPTGVAVAGGLANVKISIYRGGEAKVYAENGLVDVKRGRDIAVDLRKGEVQMGGVPANKDAPVQENTYPANNDVPATKNTNGNHN
ncbi:hypothetical protein MKW98_024510 [Papaver atlanticum]|uniref:Uncharacterized protein n=1 Tax=Papaver atlanticum TaxID=357466 RepID=A0AAD4RVJ2_9MAGN|nr:hypothetical protein MKW98_024510 [Papaver atlanticum]